MASDCAHLGVRPRDRLGQWRYCRETGSSLLCLSAETFHYHDDEVRRVLATIENIICLDRGLDIVVEGSVVKHFPGPVDLVKHIVLDIVSLLFQPFNPLSQFK